MARDDENKAGRVLMDGYGQRVGIGWDRTGLDWTAGEWYDDDDVGEAEGRKKEDWWWCSQSGISKSVEIGMEESCWFWELPADGDRRRQIWYKINHLPLLGDAISFSRPSEAKPTTVTPILLEKDFDAKNNV